jgi:DNA repair protein RecO (recombination protein O)
MRWSDEAIVLSARRHGESALLVHLLTRERGRHAGLVRGGQRPKARAPYQIGNRLTVTWSARLTEHLGTLQGELLTGYAAALIEAPPRLACLAAAAALADAALPEREPHPKAYAGLESLLDSLARDEGWAASHVVWELALLAELGFGIDLARCAATGATADLVYVSPKSGCAVSAAAGEPYRRKLLALPPFLRLDSNGAPPAAQDVLDGLALTGFFLERRVFDPQGRKLPAARSRFVDVVRRFVTISSRQRLTDPQA